MTRLHYQGGTSDKIYEVSIVPAASRAAYNVHFAYGRRGSTLKTGVKNSYPVAEAEAQRIHDRLVQEKLAKGYRIMSSDGAIYTERYIIDDRRTPEPPAPVPVPRFKREINPPQPKLKTKSGKHVLIAYERSLEL